MGAAALRSACEKIVNADCGSQDATLNSQCYGIGQLVAGGELPEAEALSALREAAANIPDYDPKNPWNAGESYSKGEAVVHGGQVEAASGAGSRTESLRLRYTTTSDRARRPTSD